MFVIVSARIRRVTYHFLKKNKAFAFELQSSYDVTDLRFPCFLSFCKSSFSFRGLRLGLGLGVSSDKCE